MRKAKRTLAYGVLAAVLPLGISCGGSVVSGEAGTDQGRTSGGGGGVGADGSVATGGVGGGVGGTGGGIGGRSGAGATAGVAGTGPVGGSGGRPECPPSCKNWCQGTEVLDQNGCVTGFVCPNGADPCVTLPCKPGDPASCPPGETCHVDQLCWPGELACDPGTCSGSTNTCACDWACSDGSKYSFDCVAGENGTRCNCYVNGVSTQTCKQDLWVAPCEAGWTCCTQPQECKPLPDCNWCNGQVEYGSDGCPVRYRCANGADPCVVGPCSPDDPATCPPGRVCGSDRLCWPQGGTDCAGGCGVSPEACQCSWTCADGTDYSFECRSSAGGVTCECYQNDVVVGGCGSAGPSPDDQDPCAVGESCCGMPPD